MFHKRKKTKFNWKSGAGELLGFAIIAPVMLLAVCAMVSTAKLTITAQRLLYTAYCTGRAAVVADTKELAQQRASAVLHIMFPEASLTFGSSASPGAGASCSIYTLAPSADAGYSDWAKGNVIKCTVSEYVRVIMPFSSGVKSQSVVMMIENSSQDKKHKDMNIRLP